VVYFSISVKYCLCTTLQTDKHNNYVEAQTFTKSVMLSVTESKMGIAGLFFVEPGLKVNSKYYRNVLLIT